MLWKRLAESHLRTGPEIIRYSQSKIKCHNSWENQKLLPVLCFHGFIAGLTFKQFSKKDHIFFTPTVIGIDILIKPPLEYDT